MVEALLVVIAGGAGAVVRYLVDGALARHSQQFPLGIFLVNAVGSLLLGGIVGLDAADVMPARWATVLGVGFCGAFTTFSTAAVDAARLAHTRRWRAFAGQWLGMFALCAALGWAGYALGTLCG